VEEREKRDLERMIQSQIQSQERVIQSMERAIQSMERVIQSH